MPGRLVREALSPPSTAMNKRYIIDGPEVRFCPTLAALGGQREPRDGAWSFPTAEAAANALSEVYRATRASPRMLAILREMIADGTGCVAWGAASVADPRLAEGTLADLSRSDAAQLIVEGFCARAYFGWRRTA